MWGGAWRGELGLEPTPELYVQHLVEAFREVRRVLRKDGTLWLNLGDGYAGSARQSNGLKPKDLCGMPWRVALALQADGWWLRSDIIWVKPNPVPESVTDRPTKAHEYLFLLTQSQSYYFDQNAVREPRMHPKVTRISAVKSTADGRNFRTVWTIPTQPFREAHFATFPEKLVEPCIRAGTSERGCCARCVAPWERTVQPDEERLSQLGKGYHDHSNDLDEGMSQKKKMPQPKGGYITVGWHPTCSHDAKVVPCTVLDCFSGSGTTGVVARKLGRHFIGLELNPSYVEMARRRIGGVMPLSMAKPNLRLLAWHAAVGEGTDG
jgi:DNA modification methylase